MTAHGAERLVLAYSGGLDTSVLLKKLIAEGREVVAMTADLGESDGASGADAAAELARVAEKARALGAYATVMVEARERFYSEYVMPALAANASYQCVYPLSAALSRPLIAALLVETAERYGASSVAHGCTGKGNDQVRIELGVRSLAPHLTVRAPLREQPFSRPEALAYAARENIPVSHTSAKPYSIDANLWGRSIEAGVLEDLWTAPPEDAFAWTAGPAAWPKEPAEIEISWTEGVPRSTTREGVALVAWLNELAGKHGVGRIDMVEDRVIGVKSREVYEAPAATVLITAHRALERLVLTRDELRFKAGVDQRYAELAYDGLWTSPLRGAFDAFNAALSHRMTGTVRLRLQAGAAVVTGLASPFALYDEKLATYGAGDRFDHGAAGGFIQCYGLPLLRHAEVARV